jgi:hypothetical protein
LEELQARRGWDRGLDFDATRKSLTDAFEAEKARFQGQEGYQSRAVVYLGAALVQLVNGARASEAWDGYLSWLKHGLRNNQVRTRKRGSMLVCHMCAGTRSWSIRSKEGEEEARRHAEEMAHQLTEELIDVPREVLIPEELSDDDREPLQSLLTEHTTLSAYKVFLISKMGMNSHSLRYALINKLGQMKIPAQVGMTITKHAKEEQFAGYQRGTEGHRILMGLMKKPKVPSPKSDTSNAPE